MTDKNNPKNGQGADFEIEFGEARVSDDTETEVVLDGDDDLEVEVVEDDSISEEDRKALQQTPVDDIDSEELKKEIDETLAEVEQYGDKGWQRRIRKSHKNFHDMRRRADAYQRREKAALDHAKKLAEENKRLRAERDERERALLDTAQYSFSMEERNLRREFAEAREADDTDKMFEISRKLSDLSLREQRFRDYKPLADEPVPDQPQVQQGADPRFEEWHRDNPWFQHPDYESETLFMFGEHKKLINKGITPDSDEYWTEINRTVQTKFPELAGGTKEVEYSMEPTRQPPRNPIPQKREVRNSPVAPAQRSAPSDRAKRVKLTADEMAVARELGVDPKDYARRKMELG